MRRSHASTRSWPSEALIAATSCFLKFVRESSRPPCEEPDCASRTASTPGKWCDIALRASLILQAYSDFAASAAAEPTGTSSRVFLPDEARSPELQARIFGNSVANPQLPLISCGFCACCLEIRSSPGRCRCWGYRSHRDRWRSAIIQAASRAGAGQSLRAPAPLPEP